MKKKFKMLMAYLRGFKKESINFELSISSQDVEEINIYDGIDMTSTFYSYFESIVNQYADELYDEGPGSADNASDYFYVDGDIYPSENKIVFNQVRFTEYGTEDSGTNYHFDEYEGLGDSIEDYFIEVRKFLDKKKITSATVSYNGGGDSGYIEGTYESEKGTGDISGEIEDICYSLLEEYGGWEINEGSQGTIVFTKDEIEVNHEWNTEVDETNEINIEITEDSLS
jgi:hypothetical protein